MLNKKLNNYVYGPFSVYFSKFSFLHLHSFDRIFFMGQNWNTTELSVARFWHLAFVLCFSMRLSQGSISRYRHQYRSHSGVEDYKCQYLKPVFSNTQPIPSNFQAPKGKQFSYENLWLLVAHPYMNCRLTQAKRVSASVTGKSVVQSEYVRHRY